MGHYTGMTTLEIVELYAEDRALNLISSEEELSERFDDEVLPHIIETHGTKGEEFTDTIMINEEFNNWSDTLCKEGDIHEEQYNNYEYVGKLSD